MGVRIVRHLFAAALLLALPVLAGAKTTCQVSEGEVRLTTGNHTYTVGHDGMLQPLGLRANIVGELEGKGIWMFPTRLTDAKVLRDTAEAKAVTATWELTAGEPRYVLELDLEVREGVPALFVKSRVRRLSVGFGTCYYYWGFATPVTHYALPGTPLAEFSATEWQVLPRAQWLYLKPAAGDQGFGLLSDGRVGRSPATGEGLAGGETASTPYLLCSPRTQTLGPGDDLDVTFAIFTARNAREVEALAGRMGQLNAGKAVFDFQSFPSQAFRRAKPPRPAVTLATEDGLRLRLSREGQVADLRVGKRSLAPASGPASGLLLRDFAAKTPPQPVGGRLRRAGDTVRQEAVCAEVAVTASYTALPNRIDVRCELKDRTGKDRALTLYFALPVRAGKGWQWHDDLERTREITPQEEYLSAAAESPVGANGLNSLYPFATFGSREVALAASIPLDQPRVCRMVYNAELQQFFLAFDLALVPEVKRWPGSASVAFSLFTHDPAWGFRACAEKYYQMFPQFFTKRVKRDGGWVCWGNCANVPDIEELGFAYHWGGDSPEGVAWDNAHGIYSFPYVEATNMHQTMEEFESATSEDVVKRLQWMADPARTERLPNWHYNHPYGVHLGDRDAALRQSAQAYLKSLLYDEEGRIYGSASKTEFDLLIAKYVPCNANPALPGGLGAYYLDTWIPKYQALMESKGGKIDGIAQDNYHVGDTALSRRREHFAHETIPLTFERRTGQPVIAKYFTTYQFTEEYKRRHPEKLVIANTCSAQYPFTYQLLDIHGYEWNIESLAPFARALAYRKPVCSLPVQPPHKEERWIKWHLRYAFFPGGYANSETYLNREAMRKYVPVIRDLSLAGWEPITRARCADADIAVERFGPDRFTLFKGAAAEKRAVVRLEQPLLQAQPTRARDLLTGAEYPITDGAFTVTLPANDVTAVRLE